MGHPFRLAPGHHLYQGADGAWRSCGPDDDVTLIRAPGASLRELQRVLAGETPAGADLLDLIDALERRGVLVGDAGPDTGTGDRVATVVHVEGDNPIAHLTAGLLEPHVKVVRGPAGPPGAADMVVSCEGWLPDARWRRLDRLYGEHGIPWHRCHAEGRRFYLGPCSMPGRTASYADTRARRLAAARLPDELIAHWAHLDTGRNPPVPWPSPGGVAVIAGLLVADVLACLAGRPMPGEGCQLAVDPVELSVSRHPVIPPGPVTPPGGGTTGPAEPVDPRFGLIRRVVPEPAALRSCVVYRAHVSATERFAPWRADRVTGGAALDDPGQARRAAVGEAVERYCGNAVPGDLPRGSYATLGRPALDPAEFALYSPAQYAARGFPFVPMTRDLEIEWTPGRDLATGEEVLVPASLVYLNYVRRPHTNFHANAGIAAGGSRERAERSALEELFERDAVTLWWTRGEPATGLEPPGPPPSPWPSRELSQGSPAPAGAPGSPRPAGASPRDHAGDGHGTAPHGPAHVTGDPDRTLVRALAEAASAGLKVSFLRIPSDFGVPVAGAFVEDPARRIVALGTACRATVSQAAAKAFTEAVVSYTMSVGLLDPATWRAVDHPYRPFREDRSYRDAFRADWHDLTDLELNLQLYLDPRTQGTPLERLRNPPVTHPLTSVPPAAPETYLDRLARHGLRAVSVDLTTPDVRAAGLRVVRVVVPGLYGNAPAAFPFLGGTRLGSDPGGDDPVLTPLPFA